MALVFQYGSNTSLARLNGDDRLCGEARVVGLARTAEPHHLDFTVYSQQNGCAAADIVRDATGPSIWGVVYEIPGDLVYRAHARDGRRCLDAIEDEGRHYTRTAIALQDMDGHAVSDTVETYVVRERRPGLVTNHAYASHIVRGLLEHRAPRDYLDYVIGRILTNNPQLDERALRSLE